MLELIGLFVIGLAVGTYAGAVGAGGGFLLAPVLLLRYPDAPPEQITTATLTAVAISNAASSLYAARLRRRLDVRLAALLVAVALPPALLGAAATTLLPRAVFTAGFALLLVATGTFLIWRPVAGIVAPVADGWRREIETREGTAFVYRVPVLRSVVATALAAGLSTLAGIGGGLLYAPLATRVMRIPHGLAVPLAQVLITAVAASAAGLHFAAGHAGDPLDDIPPLVVGVVLAVPLARRLHDRLGEGALTRALAAGLFVVGLRTALLSF